MISRYINMQLECIANTGSTLLKEEMLRDLMLDSEECVNIVKLAYDPFITFGVRPSDLTTGSTGDKFFTPITYALFDALASRAMVGNAARDAIQFEYSTLEPESRKLLLKILNKDLRAGFSVKTINSAIKGTIPEFSYMRCSLESEIDPAAPNWQNGVLSQEKADGLFINLSCSDSGASIHTRKGQPYDMSKFPRIAEEVDQAEDLNGMQGHGEMRVLRGGELLSRQAGNGILNSVRLGGDFPTDSQPILDLWDWVPLEYTSKGATYPVPYYTRLNGLRVAIEGFTSMYVMPTEEFDSLDAALLHYKRIRAAGGEGTIRKSPMGFWINGTSRDQVKKKAEFECELAIIGKEPGKGKYAGMVGALICASECGELEVGVSGLTDEQRISATEDWDSWLYKICTVRANSTSRSKKTRNVSLYLPRFIELRYDLDEADTLERILEIEKHV